MRKTLCRAAESNFIPEDTDIFPVGKLVDLQKRLLRHLQWCCGMWWTFFTFLYHREWLCSCSLPFNYFPYASSQGRYLYPVRGEKKACASFCFLLFSLGYWGLLCQSLLACFLIKNSSPKPLNLTAVRYDLSSLLFHSLYVQTFDGDSVLQQSQYGQVQISVKVLFL